MSSLSVLNFGSQGIRFEQRNGRVWGCLTDMAKATGKRVNDWQRLQSTEEFLNKAVLITGIPVISTLVGGGVSNEGTWAIEEVVLDFAAWCNVDFRFWVWQQIKTLFNTGKVELHQQPELPPSDIRVVNLHQALTAFGVDITNPRFNQELKDLVGDILGLTQKVLPQPLWCGVAERAEQLGYAVCLVTKHRVSLGKFVKAWGLEPRKEKRLCNGIHLINLYEVTEALDQAITEFMDAKVLTTAAE